MQIRLDRRPRTYRMAGALIINHKRPVEVVGMLFHLNDTFFREQTLHNLVYTAPFIAPLSYAGLGLLIIAGCAFCWNGLLLCENKTRGGDL